jgi:hypothetical protein
MEIDFITHCHVILLSKHHHHQVWPFCLSNQKDGFWEDKIGKPFRRFEESALTLLYALLDAVMMRHSKSQRYLDDRQLVDMPSRTIEWRGFDIQNDSEKYIYSYLESFAADALDRFLLHIFLIDIILYLCCSGWSVLVWR